MSFTSNYTWQVRTENRFPCHRSSVTSPFCLLKAVSLTFSICNMQGATELSHHNSFFFYSNVLHLANLTLKFRGFNGMIQIQE